MEGAAPIPASSAANRPRNLEGSTDLALEKLVMKNRRVRFE